MNERPAAESAEARAREIAARQAEEIERMRQQLDEAQPADELRRAVRLAGIAGAMGSPFTHTQLLERILATAAQVMTARSGALFLIDNATQELVFAAAVGPKAADVKQFRIPVGHGIAGLVALSGQPMAIADAEQNPQQASDIAQSVGYVPQSIVCVPLVGNEQVIGVLELLDKAATASFDAADIDLLGLFANVAALAIEQSSFQHNLVALILEAFASGSSTADPGQERVRERVQAFAAAVSADKTYQQALELAQLVQEIAGRGEHELRGCRAMLQGFADYLRTRPDLFAGSELSGW